MTTPLSAQGPIAIPEAPWALWQLTTARYDHATAPGVCPICGGHSWLWSGWMQCDGPCWAVAAPDGRTYLPIPIAKPRPSWTRG